MAAKKTTQSILSSKTSQKGSRKESNKGLEKTSQKPLKKFEEKVIEKQPHVPKKTPDLYAIFNWKMNPRSEREARDIFDSLKENAPKLRRTNAVVCPPTLYLSPLVTSYRGKKIFYGVQDGYFEDGGAWTGEISFEQAENAGATYAIVNHSERKKIGESKEIAAKKLKAVFRHGLKPVLCIGEGERDESGSYFKHVENELSFFLSVLTLSDVSSLIIAYEPIWAIGENAKKAATPHDLHEMSLFMRKLLIERYGKDRAYAVPLLYGGSVDSKNAEVLMETGEIKGFLLGRASLNPSEFLSILTTLEKSSIR